MKKIITLIALTFGLFISSQTLSAQTMSHEEIKKEADHKVMKLDQKLDLTKEQKKTIEEKYYSYVLNYDKYITNQESSEKLERNKTKFDRSLETEMKKILTDEQFSMYKKMKN